MTTSQSAILSAIREGASRPVNILPGEAGATFVRRLYDSASRNLAPTEREYFRLIRSTCQRANTAAQRHSHKEASLWISLAKSILDGLSGEAHFASFSCIKSNEAFVFYMQQEFEAALECLDEALKNKREMGALPHISSNLENLMDFHYLHLRGKIFLEEGKIDSAIGEFETALTNSMHIKNLSIEDVELIDYSLSRIAGEISVAAALSNNPEIHLSKTESISKTKAGGSFQEYVFFRDAYRTLHTEKSTRDMIEIVKSGRRKTVCWYSAVIVLMELTSRTEARVIATHASTWRDMPILLCKKLIQKISE